MNKEQVKRIIKKMCLEIWGKTAVKTSDWDIDRIAAAVYCNCEKYGVDMRLALAQGIAECHFAVAPGANRSRKTRNIFNVGNVDSGGNRYMQSYEQGIETYCRLISREYNWSGKMEMDPGSSPGRLSTGVSIVTAESLIEKDFRRPKGGRYATDPNYTELIKGIVKRIDKALVKERKDGN